MANRTAIEVDLRDLRDLAQTIRRAEPELARQIRDELRSAGNKVRLDASRRAWASSSKIPGSIVVRTNGFNVAVVAGGSKAPNAAPFEHGGLPGTFRHPVFGNREVWVEQTAHPFLSPSFEAKQQALIRGMIEALDTVFERLGFSGRD